MRPDQPNLTRYEHPTRSSHFRGLLLQGTPEIGGLTTLEAQQLIRGLHALNLVGADLVEASPLRCAGRPASVHDGCVR